MSAISALSDRVEIDVAPDVPALLAAVGKARAAMWLDGGARDDGWDVGPLLAIEPEVEVHRDPGGGLLERIDRLVKRRRLRGGSSETGVAVLLAYEALDAKGTAADPGARAVVLRVDRSLRLTRPGRGLLTIRDRAHGALEATRGTLRRLLATERRAPAPARVADAPRTSLPREAYLAAVRRIREHIRAGDVYQANLCQRFTGRYRGDEASAYVELARRLPAPRSAFVATPEFAVASVSPEVFLRVVPPDHVETWPIKGTRPRGDTPEADRAAREDLLHSEKDRAELLMIVDLERNDLGRVCATGSVAVSELATLRSFSSVHHLVARVSGRLRSETRPSELLAATFPGGSISGAPKIRAREILHRLEPVPRGFFTGSLCWIADDGSFDSSILIRTIVFRGGRFYLGAGGGIVADSDPEQEWHESNAKARALADVMGFAPEEAR